jgi:hypothetical protein
VNDPKPDSREMVHAGDGCTAFVVIDGDRANVHVLRHGQRPLTIFGASVVRRDAKRQDDAASGQRDTEAEV